MKLNPKSLLGIGFLIMIIMTLSFKAKSQDVMMLLGERDSVSSDLIMIVVDTTNNANPGIIQMVVRSRFYKVGDIRKVQVFDTSSKSMEVTLRVIADKVNDILTLSDRIKRYREIIRHLNPLYEFREEDMEAEVDILDRTRPVKKKDLIKLENL